MDRRLLLAALVVLGLGFGFAGWLGHRRAEAPAPDLPSHEPTARAVGEDRIAGAALRECPDGPAPVELGGVIELRVFLGAGVEPIRVDEVLSAARRYWGRYGVEVRLAEAPRTIANESMFVGGFDEVEGLAGDAEALAELLYRELRAFMRANALPRRGGVNVVVVRDIVHPRAAAAAVLGDLVGLTLSPELLATGDPMTEPILTAIDIGADFEPTVLLSDRHLRRLEGVAFVGAVAHELGHALSLAHDERSDNLMARGEHDCLPGLDQGQLEQLARALAIPFPR